MLWMPWLFLAPLSAQAGNAGETRASAPTSIRQLDPEVLIELALGGPRLREQESLIGAAKARTTVAQLSPLDGMVVGLGTDPAAESGVVPGAYVSLNVGGLLAWPSRVQVAKGERTAQAARAEALRAVVRAEVLALIEGIALQEIRVHERQRTLAILESMLTIAEREFAAGRRPVDEMADLQERRGRVSESLAEASASLRTQCAQREAEIGTPLSRASQPR